MEQIDKRLSSQGISYRVHTHERGLTYFPSDKDRPKAFWVTLVVSPSGKSLLIDSGKMVRDLA